MPEIILDTCVFSNFALSHSLDILKRCYHQDIHVTSFVVGEILKGFHQGYRELGEINKALAEEWVTETKFQGKEERALFVTLSVSLGAGEASSIAIAKHRGFTFASDDLTARREANLLGITLTGTLGILLKAVQLKLITLKKGDGVLNRMKEEGFYTPVKSLKDIKIN